MRRLLPAVGTNRRRGLELPSGLSAGSVAALCVFGPRVAQRVDPRLRPSRRSCLCSADDMTDHHAERMRPLRPVCNWLPTPPTVRLELSPVRPDLLPAGAVERGIAPVPVAAALPRHRQILELGGRQIYRRRSRPPKESAIVCGEPERNHAIRQPPERNPNCVLILTG